ncbi:NAD(P)-dependent oxidoreductase [Candidatus Pacearchaeota archaeon]|nr:NAD(P)-dependent oxidoreductase [Candidatus Pacearchaeota archaeon]
MEPIKKILITGSTGYCGNFLAVHFGEKGIPVVGIDIVPHPVVKDTPNFKFIQADIRDRNKLREIFEEEKPSHVIHLAYLMDPHHDKKFEYDVDVMGSKYTFELANETKSVKQFILMGSASAYGAWKDNPEWIDEDHIFKPRDYNYGIYKKEIEEYYQSFDKREDMKLVVFRMCTAVGPSYYKPGGVVSSVSKAPFLINMLGGNMRVQFIHEYDVIDIFDKIIKDEKVEDTFNLAPDSYSDTKELGEYFNKKFIPIPEWLLRGAFFLLWHLRIANLTPAMARLMTHGITVSPKKLMKYLNYKFKYTTKEAFLDAVERRKKNGTL